MWCVKRVDSVNQQAKGDTTGSKSIGHPTGPIRDFLGLLSLRRARKEVSHGRGLGLTSLSHEALAPAAILNDTGQGRRRCGCAGGREIRMYVS